MGRGKGDEGQAAVELALILPFLAMLALVLLQVTVVVRDQVLVTHAAREGAREAAVDSASSAPRRGAASASPSLDNDRLNVNSSGRGRPGSRVRVEVTYASPTKLPLVGQLIGDIQLRGTATMRVEK
ncbi:MAG: TadE family type IV pilus minor pilin [Acidimicrobiales bacterium]